MEQLSQAHIEKTDTLLNTFSESVMNYVIRNEKLYKPESSHREQHSTGYFINRLQNSLLTLKSYNPEFEAKRQAVINYLKDSQENLEMLGWVGTARAHAIYSAFDIVSRTVGTEGSMDFLLSHTSDGSTVMEHLLISPSEITMTNNEDRELFIKNEFRGEIENKFKVDRS